MKLKLLLLFVFSCFFLIGKSQSRLTVIVKDSVTKETLPGASVAVLTTGLGGSTNADGKIAFTKILEGKYEVKTSLIGYRDKKTSVEIPLDTLRSEEHTSELQSQR